MSNNNSFSNRARHQKQKESLNRFKYDSSQRIRCVLLQTDTTET